MSLQDRLDAFKANFEAGNPPYNAPAEIHEPMRRATAELIASGRRDRRSRSATRRPPSSSRMQTARRSLRQSC